MALRACLARGLSSVSHGVVPRLVPVYSLAARQHIHKMAAVRETFPIRFPALSPTMEEGTLVEWQVAVGDEINVGDVMFEVQTDKAVMAAESTEDGYLAQIIVESGTDGIPINALVGVMVEEEGEEPEDIEDGAPAPAQAQDEAPPPASQQAAAPVEVPATEAASDPSYDGAARPLSPAVVRLVGEYGLDVAEIAATGPKGHILKGDVLAFVAGETPVRASASTAEPKAKAQPKAQAQASGSVRRRGRRRAGSAANFTDVPTTNMRKIIAQRLSESKSTVPHSYSQIDVDIGSLVQRRKDSIAAGEPKYSLNDAIIKAAAFALRAVPSVNASLGPDGSVQMNNDVDISVAVATEGGLITPIVTRADSRSVSEVSSVVADLAGRARDNKLAPHEFQGGSFSVSNLGMFGVSQFSAVINPPQSCILAVGTMKPSFNASKEITTMMSFRLSCDARVVDDSEAAQWLSVFKSVMEHPPILLPPQSLDFE